MPKKTLATIAKKTKTDKLSHGYIPEYEKYLPKKIDTLLEIGVAFGASALMWNEYYESADIHIFDLFKDPDHVSPKWCRSNFLIPYKGDQGNLSDLAQITNQMDIVIDDGSHYPQHMLISFKHLFHNNLVSGGIYSIEDTHCNKDPFFNGGYVTKFEETPLWMFKNYLETGELVNPYFNSGENEAFKNMIKDVKILVDEKLILIWRK